MVKFWNILNFLSISVLSNKRIGAINPVLSRTSHQILEMNPLNPFCPTILTSVSGIRNS